MSNEPKIEPKKTRPVWLTLLRDIIICFLFLSLGVVGCASVTEVGWTAPKSGPFDEGSVFNTVLFREPETVINMWLWTMKWVLPCFIVLCLWHRFKGEPMYDDEDKENNP